MLIVNDEQRREVEEGVPPFSVRPQRDGSYLVWDRERDALAYPRSLTRVDVFHVLRRLCDEWRARNGLTTPPVRDVIPLQPHEQVNR